MSYYLFFSSKLGGYDSSGGGGGVPKIRIVVYCVLFSGPPNNGNYLMNFKLCNSFHVFPMLAFPANPRYACPGTFVLRLQRSAWTLNPKP